MLVQINQAPGRATVWINANNVTFIEEIGTGGQRCKVHFAGGEAADLAVSAQTVVAVLQGQLR